MKTSFVFKKSLLALTISVLALTACNKTETPAESSKTETPAQTTTQAATEPAETDSTTAPAASADVANSATVAMVAKGLMISGAALISPDGNLNEQQKSCLFSADAVNAYKSVATTQVEKTVGSDYIKEADKFYETEVGKKLMTVIDQQIDMMQGKPVATPLELTDADKAEIEAFNQSEIGKKLNGTAENADQAQALEIMKELTAIAEKEKARCQIS